MKTVLGWRLWTPLSDRFRIWFDFVCELFINLIGFTCFLWFINISSIFSAFRTVFFSLEHVLSNTFLLIMLKMRFWNYSWRSLPSTENFFGFSTKNYDLLNLTQKAISFSLKKNLKLEIHKAIIMSISCGPSLDISCRQ